ncbi:phenolic glucoside malonyltransferase 1-like [Apium graveolens]|uniref:phenolic glucoside malonyltransferase 1-like n=1 Tax=Apium graveolens TaxID=4045 RepID=UPI003D78BB7F
MAKTACNMVTVLEHCRVSPPLDPSITQTILPLTFFDLMALNWPPLGRVLFYDFPCSTTEFMQTLVPHLKKSLAFAFKYYFPFCGNLITPTNLANGTAPALRYLDNDSVLLTMAEFSGATSQGFKHLSGNHPRDVDEFFALVPKLPGGDTHTVEDGTINISPVLSIQLTLFPDQGFSIGFTNSHVAADGKTMSNFIRTWASINAKQLNGEHDCDSLDTLPFYDRSVIKEPKGIASLFIRAQHENSKALLSARPLQEDRVQATFVMNIAQIQGLKNLVLDQIPRVSAFIVACAYVWTCMAKARVSLGHETEEEEHLIFGMDARARLDPPIPANYFGNAVLGCWNTLKTRQLVGEDGFYSAVQQIRKVLDEKINNEEGVLKGLETHFEKPKVTKGQTKLGVSGSPKFDYYSTDFGWGKPRKYEQVPGVCMSRDLDGVVEIGICLSKKEMDAFSTTFNHGFID